MKIHTSQLGYKFSVSVVPKPSQVVDGHTVVYFTKDEFDWLMATRPGAKEFEFLWLSKRDDYTHPIIPVIEPEVPERKPGELDCQFFARTIGQEILNSFQANKKCDT